MIDFFENRFLKEIRSYRENQVLGPRGSYGPETQLNRFGIASGSLWTTPRPPEIQFLLNFPVFVCGIPVFCRRFYEGFAGLFRTPPHCCY